ncbi:sensor histidine kinase [Chitinophaga sancti]|uniref:Histidine kinase n=1 Tax=Chitinophaga sancti TaxID=1004 RepID=A0A1K1S431_9BACT|nr:histidine kinase [Chitinophaga sancti]WQD63751.1 histidine kinase [Chitinophaga sancti]WQG90624.1 histidine kinase [Chitinophaga sancti]SFW79078.1 Histidine kinase [Chitinophaga sancti]
MIFILAGGTILMRLNDFHVQDYRAFLQYFAMVTGTIFCSWMVHGYLRLHEPKNVSKQLRPIVRIAAGMVVACFLNYLSVMLVPRRFIFTDNVFHNTYADFLRIIIGAFFISMICHIVWSSLAVSIMLQKAQLENEHLKQAHLRAQLLSLQQQISPHFLFNSLSTLKHIAHDKGSKDFVVQLSHVYRYLLNINEQQVTKLADELNFIDSYLYILYQRFEGDLKVQIDIPEQYHSYLIPPLAIQLLIENAIKHNALSPEMPLLIKIFIQNETVTVSNTLQPKKYPVESTRLGLQNINERFQLLFDKQITIVHTENSFTVHLPVISHDRYYH